MRGPVAEKITCMACGRDFERFYRAGRHVFCKSCTAKADREIARKPRVDCKECGKAFPTRTRTVRYCSDACRAAAARRADIERERRRRADPEKHALQLARTRARNAARRAGERGGRQPPPRAGRDAASPRRSARAAEPYPCALCGQSFVPPGGRGRRPLHCKRCRAKADRKIGIKMDVRCRECGKAVAAPNHGVRYCSKECKAAGRRRIARESARRRREDPEIRARDGARCRAWAAARRGEKKGRGGRPSA